MFWFYATLFHSSVFVRFPVCSASLDGKATLLILPDLQLPLSSVSAPCLCCWSSARLDGAWPHRPPTCPSLPACLCCGVFRSPLLGLLLFMFSSSCLQILLTLFHPSFSKARLHFFSAETSAASSARMTLNAVLYLDPAWSRAGISSHWKMRAFWVSVLPVSVTVISVDLAVLPQEFGRLGRANGTHSEDQENPCILHRCWPRGVAACRG